MKWSDLEATDGLPKQIGPQEKWQEIWEKHRDAQIEIAKNDSKTEPGKHEEHRKFILDKIEDLTAKIEMPKYFVPRYLDKDAQTLVHFSSILDKKTQREEEIKKIAAVSVWDKALPNPEEVHQIEDSERQKKVRNLLDAVEKIWNDAVHSYIDGHYFASVVSMTSLLEAFLKFKMEALGLGTKMKSLNACISILESEDYFEDKTVQSEEVRHNLEEIKDIRNDIVHLNHERNFGRSSLAKNDELHETEVYKENIEFPSEVIMRLGDSVKIKDGDYFSPSTMEVEYRYRKAARKVIELTYNCLDIINSGEATFE